MTMEHTYGHGYGEHMGMDIWLHELKGLSWVG